jgi:hypothetical protein
MWIVSVNFGRLRWIALSLKLDDHEHFRGIPMSQFNADRDWVWR